MWNFLEALDWCLCEGEYTKEHFKKWLKFLLGLEEEK